MASDQLSWMERNNVTPMKLAVVGVLATIFLGVVGFQVAPLIFRGPPGPPPPPAKRSVAAKRSVRQVTPAAQAQPNDPARERSEPYRDIARVDVDWPVIGVEDAVRHDPFQLPPVLAAAIQRQVVSASAAEEPSEEQEHVRREAFLAALAERGVDVVILDGDHAVAAIGDWELREGDVVEGLLVKKISRDGIELVRVATDNKQGEQLP